MNGMRTIDAVEPLQILAESRGGGRWEPHSAPRARMIATDTFVLEFIFRSHTRNAGRMPSVQSAQTLNPLWTYVDTDITEELAHFP
jgi:hypothetical protein